jgi:hypothetical protein
VVQAEPARIRMDVAEGVGQQVQVAVLGHLDVAEVRRGDDLAPLWRPLPPRSCQLVAQTSGLELAPTQLGAGGVEVKSHVGKLLHPFVPVW